MPPPVNYYYIVKGGKNQVFDLRLKMVKEAKDRGIKPVARTFILHLLTLRKWLKRGIFPMEKKD